MWSGSTQDAATACICGWRMKARKAADGRYEWVVLLGEREGHPSQPHDTIEAAKAAAELWAEENKSADWSRARIGS